MPLCVTPPIRRRQTHFISLHPLHADSSLFVKLRAHEIHGTRTTNYGYELAVFWRTAKCDARKTLKTTHTLDSVDSRTQAFFLHRIRCRLSHSQFYSYIMFNSHVIIARRLLRVRFFLLLHALPCPSVPRYTTLTTDSIHHRVPNPLRSNVHKHFRHGFMDPNIKMCVHMRVCARCVCVRVAARR